MKTTTAATKTRLSEQRANVKVQLSNWKASPTRDNWDRVLDTASGWSPGRVNGAYIVTAKRRLARLHIGPRGGVRVATFAKTRRTWSRPMSGWDA